MAIEKDLEGSGLNFVEVLARNVTGGNEKTTIILGEDI
jgi:hypothetical protein